jgi:hypothetical protein
MTSFREYAALKLITGFFDVTLNPFTMKITFSDAMLIARKTTR